MMAETEQPSTPKPCKKCNGTDIRVSIGSASGRKTFTCAGCGSSWPEKSHAHVQAGSLGGKKRAENQTPQERSDFAQKAVNTRWRRHKLGQNKKLGL